MNIRLNKGQRGLLLLGAVGIAGTTLYQFSEDGIRGYFWVLPVAVALVCALIALAPSSEREARASKLPAKRGGDAFDTSDVESLAKAIGECTAAVHGIVPVTKTVMRPVPNPKNTGDDRAALASDRTVRALTFSFVVVGVACRRLQTDFPGSPTDKQLYERLVGMMELAWWQRHGGLPKDEKKQALADETVLTEFTTAGRYLQDVAHAVTANRRYPFSSLYQFLEQDLLMDEEALEAKYGPLTKSLLLRYALDV